MSAGLTLLSQHLKKTLMFRDVKFDFQPGISVIYGLNRANARTSGNGNGAGKSAFFSQPGEILYESPIVGEKQDTVKTGSRILHMKIGDKQVRVDRTGSKLEIKVEGKLKKFRKKSDSKAWLAKHIPINQEEYNTYVHLDARIPHPLVMGTSTERKRFFTSFFGLDKLDIERKLFQAELSKLGKVRAAYAEVRNEYEASKDKALDPDKLALLETRLARMEAELKDLNIENKRIQGVQRLLTFETSAAEQLKTLRALCPDGISEEAFDELYNNARKNLEQDKKGLEDAEAWEQYQRDNRHYTEAFNGLSKDATKLIGKLGLKKARRKCGEALDLVTHVATEITKAEGRIKANSKITKPQKVTKPEETDKKALRAKLDSLEHQYEHAKKFKEGTCETCGQSVKVKDPAEIKKRIKKIKGQLDAIAAYQDYREDKEAYDKAQQEIETDTADLEKLKPKYESLQKYSKVGKELASLPNKPEKFEGRKLEVKVMQRMVDEDKERIQLLKFLQPNLDTIIDLQNLTKKQRKSAVEGEEIQDKITELHDKLSKLKAKLEVNSMVSKDLKRLRSRLREMKEELANEEALKLLVEGHSDKAMKKMAVQAISSRLMQEVNKYARTIFPEDYEFDFKWDSSQLQLLVNRRYGKKVVTSDVRKLSGAESKLFTIVMVLALLTFVPQRKRCNVIFLDEPTANFSPETTKAFMQLLPILNKVIPTIVIITPKSDERYEGASEFTVVKVNGESKIVAGHPAEHKKLK